jgi:predicted esterase
LDIKNQNEYISSVWIDLEKKGILRRTKKKVGFGFSQGGATMARWADQFPDRIDELILWGCKFPPDLQDEQLQNFRDEKLVRSYIGNRDEFFPPEELEKLRNIFSNVKNLDWQIYDGGHEVVWKILRELISNS